MKRLNSILFTESNKFIFNCRKEINDTFFISDVRDVNVNVKIKVKDIIWNQIINVVETNIWNKTF